jgi:transposase
MLTTKRDFEALEHRRMEAAILFRKGKSQSDVSKVLDVSRQTTSRWYQSWEKEGKHGLKAAGRAGRKPKLTQKEMKRVESVLLQGPEAFGYTTQLWTLDRISHAIEKVCHVKYHRGHVWKLLGSLGWSCQRPIKQAREKDEKAVQHWLKYNWARIKKKPIE